MSPKYKNQNQVHIKGVMIMAQAMIKGIVVNNFKFGYYGSTIYLCKGTVEFNGQIINVVSQFVDPKTSWELRHYDDYTTLYFSKSDIDKLCEELEA